MKVFPGRLALHCDECKRDLTPKEKAICIGVDSQKFDNDSRQAVICSKCIKKAMKLLK